jgi:hypothetical protein
VYKSWPFDLLLFSHHHPPHCFTTKNQWELCDGLSLPSVFPTSPKWILRTSCVAVVWTDLSTIILSMRRVNSTSKYKMLQWRTDVLLLGHLITFSENTALQNDDVLLEPDFKQVT